MSKNIKCLNCNQYGHVFRHCKNPIVSYGIIGYKVISGRLNYMMIQRKDTMGFTDFIRGKYKEGDKQDLLKIFIQEMTPQEKLKIKTMDFDSIWEDLWVCKRSGIYITEKDRAKYKFNLLDLSQLPLDEPSRYQTQEYGFPKGRKNINESPIECAIREFREETGFNKQDIKIQKDIEPLVETFTGSNGINYTHIYYIAHVISNKKPEVNKNNSVQMEEISKVEYFTFENAYNILRDYDTQKKRVLFETNEILTKKLKIITRKSNLF